MIDQNSQFFAILTNVGAAKQANADALGIPWTITHMGVGDANGTDPIPAATQTELINERRRAPLNQLKVDPSNTAIIIAEQVIPEDVGGWWIREIGLYDLDGDLVAIANCAPSFKPLLTQGSGRTQVVRMNLIVSSSSNVQLKIDPSVVLATRAYVDGLTVRATQAEAEAGTENSKIMTPLRVFQSIAKVVKQATESAFGWAKVATQAQVTTGTDDTTIITPKKLRAAQATQVEAEAGTDNTKSMTPLRVFQAIAKVVTQATESAFGWAKVATQAQVTTGTDDATIITPKKLRAAQATQAEAEAGTDNTKIMPPLRVAQLALKMLNSWGIGTDNPPGLSTFNGNTKTGFYVGYGATSPVATPGCPPESATNVLGVVAVNARNDITYYYVFENGASVSSRRFWVGQWNDNIGTIYWSRQMTFDQIATQAQVDAGVDDATIVTPKKMRWGWAASFTQNGYILFPTWLGSFLIQWVSVSTTTTATAAFTWPLAFSSFVRTVGIAHSSAPTIGNLNGVTPNGGNADTYNPSAARVVGNVQVIGVGK